MKPQPTKPTTIHLTASEREQIDSEARDQGISVNALLRARLNLPALKAGAPKGNRNAAKGQVRSTGELGTLPPISARPSFQSFPKPTRKK